MGNEIIKWSHLVVVSHPTVVAYARKGGKGIDT